MNHLPCSRRFVVIASATGLLGGLAPGFALAQEAWPTRQAIKVIVPGPPGGVADYLGRTVANALTHRLGQQVIVENKPGAGTNIGSDMVAKADPDGYTLLIASSNNAANMTLFKNMPYDTAKDFAPVSVLGYTPMVLVANAALPAADLKQFLRQAADNPGKITYASAGNGSPAHLAGESLKRAAKIDLFHIPYKGAAPAVNDLMGGHVQVMLTNIPASMGAIQSGKLKAFAVTGKARSPALPDLPTFAEAGLPSYTASAWYGIVAPKGTPTAIVDRLSDEIRKVMTEPAMAKRIEQQGIELAVSTPVEFKALIASDIDDYRTLIRERGIHVE